MRRASIIARLDAGESSAARAVWPALPALILLFAVLPVPGRAHAGLQRRGRHARLVRQGAGRGALPARLLEHLRDRAAASRLICLLLGYPLGFLIATTTPGWATLGFIFVLLPLWTSRAGAHLCLDGAARPQRRVQPLADRWRASISDPLPLLHNFTGVLIGMVHVLLPYMVLPIYGAVRRLDPALVAGRRRGWAPRAGASSGASTCRSRCTASSPAAVLVFVLSLGFFITPALLGGGRVMMIAVLIEQQVRETLNWPFAAALSAVLLALHASASIALAQRFTRQEARQRRREPPRCSSRRRAALIYFFLMLPLLVVFPISLSSAPYMQFPPPGLVLAVVRALPRRSAMDRRHLALALYRRRHGGAGAAAGRAARLQPGARQVPRPRRWSIGWRWRPSSCRPSSCRSRSTGCSPS